MNEIIKSSAGEIQAIAKQVKEMDYCNLSDPDKRVVEKLVLIDTAKAQLNSAIDKSNFDYQGKKEMFLKSFPAENTRKVYSKAFTILETYLSENALTTLDMTAEETDRFILSLENLKQKPSQSTKRLYISALSSFFSQIERYGYIKRNPFHGSRLPKPLRKRELKILTEDNFKKIMDTLTPGSGRGISKRTPETMEKWKVIFELLRATGLRISAVKTLKIGEHGNLTYWSKGKAGGAVISLELAKRLRGLDLSEITENSIQKALQKACERAGLPVVNPHAIRHLFATEHYKKYKDIYRLKELLNHSSIAITEHYLKSLKAI